MKRLNQKKTQKLRLLLELISIFLFCGNTYVGIEILYRGYSFREMFFLAGVIGLIAYYINNTVISYETDALLQCAIVTVMATIGEGVTGHLCNRDYHIWDYRGLKWSFWDNQCNLYFVIAWFAISAIMIPILDYIDWKCFNGKKPHYRVLGYNLR